MVAFDPFVLVVLCPNEVVRSGERSANDGEAREKGGGGGRKGDREGERLEEGRGDDDEDDDDEDDDDGGGGGGDNEDAAGTSPSPCAVGSNPKRVLNAALALATN